MEQLTKNQAVATSQEAVQNQNEPQLRDENAHNDKSVHGVLNPTYQAGLRRDAVQPDIEAERKKRDEIEAGKSYCSRRFGGATCDDKSAQIYARSDKNDWRIQPAEFYRFHALHFMRPLPTGSVDPNFGRRVRNRRQLNSLQNTWPYGYSMPIAVRYTKDAFSRSGWLWPVDAKGDALKATSYMAVGFYVAKYVNKKSDMDLAAKGLGAKEWNNSLKTKLSLLPKKLFRIRMSRNFGMKMLTM